MPRCPESPHVDMMNYVDEMHPRQECQPRFHAGETCCNQTIEFIDVIGAAVADVAIRPTLLQRGDTQVLDFYDESRRLTLAERNLRASIGVLKGLIRPSNGTAIII